MKRYFFNAIVLALLLPALLLCVFAEEGNYVIDNADLLTDTEEQVLEEGISRLRQTFHMDVVIVTENSLQGARPQDHADDFYDSHGYQENGVLLLLSMEERDWYISTCGDAIYALTDYGIQCIGEEMVPYLSSGDYYSAFDTFLAELYDYFGAFQAGAPIDGFADYSGDYYHGDQEEIYYYEEPFTPSLIVALLVGIVAGAVTILVMRLSMRTGKPQRHATAYMKQNSYRLTGHRDLFLYSKVSKVRKPQNTSSGGGSSVHHSSSGRSHGGGGGKF